MSQSLDSLISVTARLLAASGKTLSTAESCTGGLLSGFITSVSGSSVYFIGGVVAYGNSVKEKILGVGRDVLERHGAVSAEVAVAMARQIREKCGSDIGISVTGIAGPAGGTVEKPVGLVYVALSAVNGERCSEFHLRGDREEVRSSACREAFSMLENALSS